MRFLNLETLGFNEKAVVDHEWKFTFSLTPNETLKSIKGTIDQVVGSFDAGFNELQGTNSFIFDVVMIDDVNDPLRNEEIGDLAESIANIVNSSLFTKLCASGVGRKRERRLDVPDNIKLNTYASMALIKSAINTQTICDVFNVRMNFTLVNPANMMLNEPILTYDLVEQDILTDVVTKTTK